MRQHASRTDDEDRETDSLKLGVALAQPDAERRDHLHAVGEAHHHDERGHDVQEKIELEAEPAEQPERPRDGDDRRQRRDKHQRDAPEEERGDAGTEEKTQPIVHKLVTLDRIADFKLHHRRARELRRQSDRIEILLGSLLDLTDDDLRGFLSDDLAVQRKHHQRKLAVLRQKFAFDDVVGLQRVEDLAEFGRVLRQVVRYDRRCVARRVRLTARRQHRHDAADRRQRAASRRRRLRKP